MTIIKYLSLAMVTLLLTNCNNESEKIANEAVIEIEDTKKIDTEKEQINDGYTKEYYPNGSTKTEGIITNGKREGIWTSWHPNGNKQSESNYVNGVLEGKSYSTFPNGQIMYIGYYAKGKYDGQWIYYNEVGVLQKEVVYKNGEFVSIKEGEKLAQ